MYILLKTLEINVNQTQSTRKYYKKQIQMLSVIRHNLTTYVHINMYIYMVCADPFIHISF